MEVLDHLNAKTKGTLYFAGQDAATVGYEGEAAPVHHPTEDLLLPDVQDILIACCVDGLKGSDAINSVFPQTYIQLCIIHMVRNCLKYVSRKTTKPPPPASGPTEEAALMWRWMRSRKSDDKYPQISKAGVRTGKTSIRSSLSAGYPQGHLYDKRNRT